MDLVFYKIFSKSIEGQVVFFWLFYFTSFVGVDSQCQKILNLMANMVKYQIMALWWWCISGIFFFFSPKLLLVHCRVWVISYFFCHFLSCKGGLHRTGVLCNSRGICGQNMLLRNIPAEGMTGGWGERTGYFSTEQDRGIRHFLIRSPDLSQQSSWGKGKRNVACKSQWGKSGYNC